MKYKQVYKFILCFTALLLISPSGSSAQNMSDYTAYPPSVTNAVAPNILLVLDHSGSMQFPAYLGCDFGGYSNKVADCGTSDSTQEPEYIYDPTFEYYGLFKMDKYYKYVSNKFNENDVCIDTDFIGSSDCASGNLLNWATMSRMDLMRKALMGGKGTSTQTAVHTLNAEGGEWTYSDDSLHCTFEVSGTLSHKLTTSDYNGTCRVGTISGASTDIDNPDGVRRGIIQNLSDTNYDGDWDDDAPRFGLMIFAADNREGQMLAGIEGSNMSSFLSALQNNDPYDGTPTGEALYEAYDYYSQIDGHNYEANNSYVKGWGSAQDPLCDPGNPTNIPVACRKNFILLVSDGEYNGTIDPVIPARELYINDLRPDPDTSDSADDYPGVQNVMTYAVYTFGKEVGGRSSLQQVAMHGRFDDYDSNTWPYNKSAYPLPNSKSVSELPVSPCDPSGTMDDECKEWDVKGNNGNPDGLPDNYYEASKGNELEPALIKAIADMLERASSGTSVSVLASRTEGETAFFTSYYYPKKLFDLEYRYWLGTVQALFVDSYGNMREDTNGDDTLDSGDAILKMEYSTSDGAQIYKCSDTTGDGKPDTCSVEVFGFDDINPIWGGDQMLLDRAHDDRNIFTTVDGSTEVDFTENSNEIADLQNFLRADTTAEAQDIINWVLGKDIAGYRKRSIMDNNVLKVWKLGDIVNSTPTAVGRPMENYDLLYGDKEYAAYRRKYKNRRQTLYVGANDGMLHAFNAGCFNASDHKFYEDVDNMGDCYSDGTTPDLGKELWGFIPRGLLPHLKWLTDPNYTHVYYVDAKPKVTDVKIFDSTDGVHEGGWGTILIGGMRYGGKDISWGNGPTAQSTSPEYFAIDITDPSSPKLLWTFSDPQLGFSMAYPSVAKVGDKWYAVFGSGATNYDEESNLTAFGNPGNVFILDISSGNASTGVISAWNNSNSWKKSTGNANTFMANPITIDVDINFDVDVMYIGENSSSNAFLHRITTKRGTDIDPSLWKLSTLANIDSIAGTKDKAKAITAAPAASMGDGNLWIYFGTGQFLGSNDKNQIDTGAFYGVKDPCWTGDCTTPSAKFLDVSEAVVNISNQIVTGVINPCSSTVPSTWTKLLRASDECDGWSLFFQDRIETEDYNGLALGRDGERAFNKPFILGGMVTWTSFIPGINACTDDGTSHVYAAYYKTGTAFNDCVFEDQNCVDKVGRLRYLGTGQASAVTGKNVADPAKDRDKVKGFIKMSDGTIIEIESQTATSRSSKVMGWSREPIP